MKRTSARFSVVLFAVMAIACGKSNSPSHGASLPGRPVEGHRDEPEHAQLPTIVRLPQQVLSNAGVKTMIVKHEELPATIDLTGEVAPDPDRLARVTAREFRAGSSRSVSEKAIGSGRERCWR